MTEKIVPPKYFKLECKDQKARAQKSMLARSSRKNITLPKLKFMEKEEEKD